MQEIKRRGFCVLMVMLLACPWSWAQDERRGPAPAPAFQSELIDGQTSGHQVALSIDITHAKQLFLVAVPGPDGYSCDWCDWLQPKLVGPDGEQLLTTIKWKSAHAGWGSVWLNRNCQGEPLRVNGQLYDNGIGTHAPSVIEYQLPAGHSFTHFTAIAGLDNGGTDQQNPPASSVQFLVFTERPPARYLSTAAQPSFDPDPDASLEQLTLHPKLSLQLFAAEPMVMNPTNIDVDHLGRVWVCEAVNYRNQIRNGDMPQREAGDRIVVLEDTDGDGRADREITFYQGRDIDSPHGICVLGNRVLLSVGEHVFWLIDTDGDLRADRKEVLFSGIGGTQHDHGIHAFVFGPDGKLYFNFGNEGKQLNDANGNRVVDRFGQRVEMQRPYQQGMVFRCNLDGSDLETLAWNFRNNWEVCVDSYGRMWQSDNDDDGNRATRINFVLPFGNYGYVSELDGSGWQSRRTGWEQDIPSRHWHLNDPGVVPNLLITGAGSPTGILFYEGELLPEEFRNQVIHCDAGPSIVRAYRLADHGAGYSATIENMLDGASAYQWFRPADVCVAPDGSLIVADWFDPGVGGHRMQDAGRGRLYRLTSAAGPSEYVTQSVDLSTPAGAVTALQSPNQATRYMAWQALQAQGNSAIAALLPLAADRAHPILAARALWALAAIDIEHPQVQTALHEALDSAEPELRACVLRMVGEFARAELANEFWTEEVLADPSPQVRATLAVELSGRRVNGMSPEIRAQRWARLASQYRSGDRWQLEALGIGAEGNWEQCLGRLRASEHWNLDAPETRDLIWRSRSDETAGLLAELIRRDDVTAADCGRYLRALDFQTPPSRSAACRALAFDNRWGSDEKTHLVLLESLMRIDGSLTDDEREQLVSFVADTEGTEEFVRLVSKFSLTEFAQQLVELALDSSDDQLTVTTVQTLWQLQQQSYVAQRLESLHNLDKAGFGKLCQVLALSQSADAARLLLEFSDGRDADLECRRQAVLAAGRIQSGAQALLKQARVNSNDPQLKQAVIAALKTSRFVQVKRAADELFLSENSATGRALPDIEALAGGRGDPQRGLEVFSSEPANCAKCHLVNGAGKSVGPELTGIGNKLTPRAMFESILYPSAGISHNYENWKIVTIDGQTINGLLVSETAETVQLKDADGIVRTISRADIDTRENSTISLMPDGLHDQLTDQQLIDLVAYMGSLK